MLTNAARFVLYPKLVSNLRAVHFVSIRNVTKYDLCTFTSEGCVRFYTTGNHVKMSNITSPLQPLKRPLKKVKKVVQDGASKTELREVAAYTTAEEYDLEGIVKGFLKEDLYQRTTFSNELGKSGDVVHVQAKYAVDKEPREMFLFREGSVVMWNVPELERLNVLKFLRQFEQGSHHTDIVQDECEVSNYMHSSESPTKILEDEMVLSREGDGMLDKYTISNGMALSVQLGTWEASLNHYIDSMELVTEDLKTGQKIKMSRQDVLRKTGELFALRHAMNLRSDLLDTPDFYWDREQLESLYHQTCTYYCITRRTKVMNEKLNHCIELVELLSSHLSDRHHVRLEWMIIILIMVEVGFEIIHYLERIVDHSVPHSTIQMPA